MEVIITAIVIVVGLILLSVIFGSKGYQDHQGKKSKLFAKLDEIKQEIESASSGELRDIVIRLDKILGDTLNVKLGKVSTVGESLKALKSVVDRNELNAVWIYHKMRNNVVHDSITVTQEDVEEMYKIYSRFIRLLLK